MSTDKHRFIEAVAVCAAALRAADLPDDDGAFTRALGMIHRDAGDWLREPGWKCESCPEGVPVERAIEVLADYAQQLLHHARVEGIEHECIGALAALFAKAAQAGLLTGATERFWIGVAEHGSPARN